MRVIPSRFTRARMGDTDFTPPSPGFLDLIFHGTRFDGHNLPVAVTPAMVAFEELVRELAAQLYRRDNEVGSSPSGFRSEFMLMLGNVKHGCQHTTLTTSLPQKGERHIPYYERARDDALDLLWTAERGDDAPQINDFTMRCLREFAEVMRPDEWLVARTNSQVDPPIRITTSAAESLKKWRSVETVRRERALVGEVTGWRKDSSDFTLRVHRYGVDLTFRYEADDKPKILEAIDKEAELRLFAVVDEEVVSKVPRKGIEAERLELVSGPEVYQRLKYLAERHHISDDTLTKARRVVLTMLEKVRGLNRPFLTFTPEHGIQAEWKWRSGAWIELEIRPQPHDMEAAFVRADGTEDAHTFHTEDEVLPWLTACAGECV